MLIGLRALFAGLMLSSATVSPLPLKPIPAAPGIAPALWKVADADTTIYLFGTIHVLPPDFGWRTDRFEQALANSEALVLEVNDLDDEKKSTDQFLRLAISPNLPPVADRVPEDRRARLQVMIDTAGASARSMQQFESWAVALALASSALRDMKLSADYGVENVLAAEFRAKRRPVLGLETSAEQLGYFDKLPEAAQRVFLVGLIDERADVKRTFDAMIAAWGAGDEAKIAITFDDELSLSSELVDVLLRQRNKNWTKWLQKRLDQPGTIMVAVGAGHLAGPESVQTMLRARGLAVERVQ